MVQVLSSFSDVLEAVESLSSDEQEALVNMIGRRLAEQSRERLAQDIQEARAEFAEGKCKAVSVDGLMEELLS